MAMSVQCTSCSTSFPVDPAKVPPAGVRARCSACGSIFRVEREEASWESEPATTEAQAFPGAAFTREESFDAPPAAEPSFDDPLPDEPSFDAPPAAEPTADAAPDAGGSASAVSAEDWVFEREPDVDPSEIEIRRLDTVEEGIRHAQDEFGGASAATASAASEASAPPAPSNEAAQPPARSAGFTFGKRDPHEKASRLARVLVSDMVTYNSERHERALAQGTVREDFEDEIKKSWDEYVDQVGRDVAESTGFFKEALNDVLARGRPLF